MAELIQNNFTNSPKTTEKNVAMEFIWTTIRISSTRPPQNK